MSAPLEHTTVMLTQTAPIQRDHTNARVTRDTQEMESPVKVWQQVITASLKRFSSKKTRPTRKN